MYTIGQVSEIFHLPISTLRYYDKQGFFPDLKRKEMCVISVKTSLKHFESLNA